MDKDTPAIVLLYRYETRASGLRGAQWCQHMQHKYGPPQGGLNIQATPLEQKLLLKLLAMNGKTLLSSYAPAKDAIEQNFRASFLLPLGPLSYQDIGKLNNDPGCILCGKRAPVRCRQCMSVVYCGSGA